MRTGEERPPKGWFRLCEHAEAQEGRPVRLDADGWCSCHSWASVSGMIPMSAEWPQMVERAAAVLHETCEKDEALGPWDREWAERIVRAAVGGQPCVHWFVMAGAGGIICEKCGTPRAAIGEQP